MAQCACRSFDPRRGRYHGSGPRARRRDRGRGRHPHRVIAAVIAFAVIALVLALVVGVGPEPGPSPGEIAVSYELAWDRLDFDALWALSGDELRDGRSRHEFMADKREAYAGQRELAGLPRDVHLPEVLRGAELAAVRTR